MQKRSIFIFTFTLIIVAAALLALAYALIPFVLAIILALAPGFLALPIFYFFVLLNIPRPKDGKTYKQIEATNILNKKVGSYLKFKALDKMCKYHIEFTNFADFLGVFKSKNQLKAVKILIETEVITSKNVLEILTEINDMSQLSILYLIAKYGQIEPKDVLPILKQIKKKERLRALSFIAKYGQIEPKDVLLILKQIKKKERLRALFLTTQYIQGKDIVQILEQIKEADRPDALRSILKEGHVKIDTKNMDKIWETIRVKDKSGLLPFMMVDFPEETKKYLTENQAEKMKEIVKVIDNPNSLLSMIEYYPEEVKKYLTKANLQKILSKYKSEDKLEVYYFGVSNFFGKKTANQGIRKIFDEINNPIQKIHILLFMKEHAPGVMKRYLTTSEVNEIVDDTKKGDKLKMFYLGLQFLKNTEEKQKLIKSRKIIAEKLIKLKKTGYNMKDILFSVIPYMAIKPKDVKPILATLKNEDRMSALPNVIGTIKIKCRDDVISILDGLRKSEREYARSIIKDQGVTDKTKATRFQTFLPEPSISLRFYTDTEVSETDTDVSETKQDIQSPDSINCP